MPIAVQLWSQLTWRPLSCGLIRSRNGWSMNIALWFHCSCGFPCVCVNAYSRTSMIPSGRFPPMSALFYFFFLCNRLILFLNYGNYSEILHCLFPSLLFFSIVCKLTGGRKDSALAPGFLGTAAVEKKNIGLLIRVMAHLTTKFSPDEALGRVDKVTGWTRDRAKTIRERLARMF